VRAQTSRGALSDALTRYGSLFPGDEAAAGISDAERFAGHAITARMRLERAGALSELALA
jgi:hypothetical protein